MNTDAVIQVHASFPIIRYFKEFGQKDIIELKHSLKFRQQTIECINDLLNPRFELKGNIPDLMFGNVEILFYH